MKTLCVTLLTIVSFALNASAISFQGTFTGTATSVSGSVLGLDSVGDTFSGTYSYESPTVDGLFTPLSGNLQVSMTFPDGTNLSASDDEEFPNFPKLNVVGGSVVAFSLAEGPAGGMNLTATVWTVGAGVNQADGTVSFSNPSPARVSSVPDAGGSALLLGLAGLGLLAMRRYLVAA